MKRWLFHVCIFLSGQTIFAKPVENFENQTDSIFSALTIAKNDTHKVNLLNNISEILWKTNYYDSALIFSNQSIELAQKLKFKPGLANSFNTKGAINMYLGNYTDAIKYYNLSLTIRKEIVDNKGIASSYNNIGNTYVYLGNYPLALKNYLTSLKIKEKLNDLKGIAATSNNIGAIYENQKNYNEAKKYYLASIKIKDTIGDVKGLGSSYINMGNLCFYQNNITDAFFYFEKALKIKEQLNDIKGVADIYHNIGAVYEKTAEFDKAIFNYLKAYEIRNEINDKKGLASSCINIGSLYYSQKNNKKAREFLNKGLLISLELGSKERISKSYEILSILDSNENKFKSAYLNHLNFIIYRDSIDNELNTKRIVEQQMQFEFDKQLASDSMTHAKETEIREAEIAKQKAELKAKHNQQIALYGGLVLVLVFAGFMYNRFKVTQRQKIVIEQQKQIVENAHLLLEEKNEEIIASIRYAKRIQDALLTSQKYIERNLQRLKNQKN